MHTHGRVLPMGGTSAASIGRPLPSVHGRALGEPVALFMSTYVNKVDRKGRVSVPATFRAAVSGLSFQGIVAYPALEEGSEEALEGAGIDRMEAISDGLDELDQSDDQRALWQLVISSSQQLPFDPEGRVLLPEHFLAHSHIRESAAFVGLGPNFQIWEPDRYAARRAALHERVTRQGTRLPPLRNLAARRRQ